MKRKFTFVLFRTDRDCGFEDTYEPYYGTEKQVRNWCLQAVKGYEHCYPNENVSFRLVRTDIWQEVAIYRNGEEVAE